MTDTDFSRLSHGGRRTPTYGFNDATLQSSAGNQLLLSYPAVEAGGNESTYSGNLEARSYLSDEPNVDDIRIDIRVEAGANVQVSWYLGLGDASGDMLAEMGSYNEPSNDPWGSRLSQNGLDEKGGLYRWYASETYHSFNGTPWSLSEALDRIAAGRGAFEVATSAAPHDALTITAWLTLVNRAGVAGATQVAQGRLARRSRAAIALMADQG